jgi:hypothetical protein
VSNSIEKKLIKIKTNLTFNIRIKMRNEGRFGQLKTVSKKVHIFEWNVLRSIMLQVYLRKIRQIPIEKINF